MRIRTPVGLPAWDSGRRRRLVAAAAVLAIGVAGTQVAAASGALASPDGPGDRPLRPKAFHLLRTDVTL